MSALTLVGGGGHCLSVLGLLESLNTWSVEGVVDFSQDCPAVRAGCAYLGHEEEISSEYWRKSNILITVGQIKSSQKRSNIFVSLEKTGANFPVIAARTSHISRSAFIGKGSAIFHQCVINHSAVIGQNTIINTAAIIEHGAIIGDHCHISTGVIINGDTVVGEGTFVGSGCTIKDNITIGKNCVIQAGSTILSSVEDNEVVKNASQR